MPADSAVADAYGTGFLFRPNHDNEQLSPDDWFECYAGDVVMTTDDYYAIVRYRHDGREVRVDGNREYHIERPAIAAATQPHAAHELAQTISGFGFDRDALFEILGRFDGDSAAIDQLRTEFAHETGRSLDDALESALGEEDLDHARRLLG